MPRKPKSRLTSKKGRNADGRTRVRPSMSQAIHRLSAQATDGGVSRSISNDMQDVLFFNFPKRPRLEDRNLSKVARGEESLTCENEFQNSVKMLPPSHNIIATGYAPQSFYCDTGYTPYHQPIYYNIHPCLHPMGYNIPTYQHFENRRLKRLFMEAVELASYLCTKNSTKIGFYQIARVINEIIPTAFIVNSGYWPVYYTINENIGLCVCKQFGFVCCHSRNEYGFLNLDLLSMPIKEDDFMILEKGKFRFVDCNVVCPVLNHLKENVVKMYITVSLGEEHEPPVQNEVRIVKLELKFELTKVYFQGIGFL